MNKKKDTSWQSVAKWYDTYLAEEGHYFHREIILPQLEKILQWKQGDSLLDIGCGQGILSRTLPQYVEYLGLDSSKSLIKAAQTRTKNKLQQFHLQDVTQPFSFKKLFTHASFILSLQNMKYPEKAIHHVAQNMTPKGKLILVLNHPCYRIPRQSQWDYDEKKKLQYRRIDRYMSSMEVPIQMKPSLKGKSPLTYSYHHSLSSLFNMLKEANFVTHDVLEWCSQKHSVGARAKAENRCRQEFPMFLCIVCERDGKI